MPAEEADLLALPYVGQYIASAVRVFAYGQRDAVVDGSVIRLFSRILGLCPNSDSYRDARVLEFARSLVPRDARAHGYGVLDFAAQLCLPGMPRCNICPLASTTCQWSAEGAKRRTCVPR